MKFKNKLNEIYNIDVRENDRVSQVKDKLCEEIGSTADNIRLIYKCKVLQNNRSIRFCNIKSDDCVLFYLINEETLNPNTKIFNESDICGCGDFEGPNCKLSSISVNIANFEQGIIYKIRSCAGKSISTALRKSPFRNLWSIPYRLIYKDRVIDENNSFLFYQIKHKEIIVQTDCCDENDGEIENNNFDSYDEQSWHLKYGFNRKRKCQNLWINFSNNNGNHFTVLENLELININNLVNKISQAFGIPYDCIKIFKNKNLTDRVENDNHLQDILSQKNPRKFWEKENIDKEKKRRSWYQYSINIYYIFVPNIDNFIRCEPIGQGSFGKVFKSLDVKSNQLFALKKIKISKNDVLEPATFATEIDVFCAIGNHPRIVEFVKTIYTDTEFYIVMEYMPQGSLRKYLQTHGALSECLISKFSRQILEALKYLHKLKIIHRDIKGDNVLLNDDFNAKLTDFGLSKYLSGVETKEFFNQATKSFVGTVNYMAPEVLNGKDYGSQADIWAVGATIIEMITGKPPYSKLEFLQVVFKVGSLGIIEYDKPIGLSEAIQDFLDLMLKSEPTARPSVNQLLDHSFLKM